MAKARKAATRNPRNFADVIERAKTDSRYAARIKSVALKARSGKPADLSKFATEFKLTPRALKALAPQGGLGVFFTGLPCTVVIATTFLSCFPNTSYGDHWFCKRAE